MDINSILQISNLSFSYPGSQPLFSNISIKFQKGGFYLIKGPSGGGKSTLLRLINRLEEPTAGKIMFKKKQLAAYDSPLLRRQILYIQQTPISIDGSVKENLMLPFSFHSNKDLIKPDDNKLRELLKNFHLNEIRLSSHAQNLSVGQLQRLCIIRGLLLSPEIILLDEPTSALDDDSCRILESKAEELCLESNRTIIMISHRQFTPTKIVPKLVEVANGKIKESKWNQES